MSDRLSNRDFNYSCLGCGHVFGGWHNGKCPDCGHSLKRQDLMDDTDLQEYWERRDIIFRDPVKGIKEPK